MKRTALMLSIVAATLFAATSTDTTDICYEPMKSEGFFCINIGPCGGGFGCKKIYPIKNLSDTSLNNVQIFYKEDGLSGSFGSSCGVDPDGTCGTVHNIEMGPVGMFGQATEFNFSSPIPADNDVDNTDVWVKNFMSGTCFSGDRLYVKYEKNGVIHEGRLLACSDVQSSTPPTIKGYFDGWDKDHSLSDRNITTKVVNERFTLTIASLNKDNNALEFKQMANVSSTSILNTFQNTNQVQNGQVDIRFALKDMNTNEYLTSWYVFDASSAKSRDYDFVVNRAARDVRIEFKACADYNGSDYNFYPFDTCAATGDCSSNTETNKICYRYFESSDNFAIRPYGFMLLGNNQYKRAGEGFVVKIRAVDEANYNKTAGNIWDIQSVADYNVSLDDLNLSSKFYVPSDDEVRQMYKDVYYSDPTDINVARSKVAYCPDSGVFSIQSGQEVRDGKLDANISYNETGILTLTLAEKPGSEFAIVDADDTPDDQRFIRPAGHITDDNNLSATDYLVFIPYKFVTTGSVTSTVGTNWLYMSNDVADARTHFRFPVMANLIQYNITAYGKGGNILKNYTATCFPDTDEVHAPRINGLKLNTTFDLFLDATLRADKNVTAQFDTIANGTTLWVYKSEWDITTDKTPVREWVGPTAFNQGVAVANVYLGVAKKYNEPVEPVNVEFLDINTSTSWMSHPDATKYFEGASVNKTYTYRYGMIKLPGGITTTDKTVSFKAKFLYFSPDGWVENKEHNASGFGTIKSILAKPQANVSVGSVANGEQQVSVTAALGQTYSPKLHYSISPWLWYNPLAKDYKDPSTTNLDCLTHPCNSVTFMGYSSTTGTSSSVNSGGWAGVGKDNSKYNETNKTIKAPAVKDKGNIFNRINW